MLKSKSTVPTFDPVDVQEDPISSLFCLIKCYKMNDVFTKENWNNALSIWKSINYLLAKIPNQPIHGCNSVHWHIMCCSSQRASEWGGGGGMYRKWLWMGVWLLVPARLVGLSNKVLINRDFNMDTTISRVSREWSPKSRVNISSLGGGQCLIDISL